MTHILKMLAIVANSMQMMLSNLMSVLFIRGAIMMKTVLIRMILTMD